MTERLRHKSVAHRISLAAALTLAFLAGCHSKSAPTPENFTTGLNAHFAEHPDCLLSDSPSFPYETTDAERTKQMDALVNSKLLTVGKAPKLHMSRYLLTDMGSRLAPRFCFGHRVVTGIDSFTPPVTTNGFPSSHVTYRYTMQDVPVWVKTDQVRAAFPAMDRQTSGTSSDTILMEGTPVGWQVPD